MAEDSDQRVTGETMETMSKSFVLLDVPDVDEDYLKDYLECTLDKGEVNLDFHPNVSSRVLVTMEHAINISDAAANIAEKQFEGRDMRVERVDIRNAVIADGDQLIEKLTLFFLKLYFQKEFAGGDEIVTACMQLPETAMAVVSFENAEVTKRVLEHEDHEPLPKMGYKIQVYPFYFNFHGFIQYKDRPLRMTLAKEINSAKKCQESQKSHSKRREFEHSTPEKYTEDKVECAERRRGDNSSTYVSSYDQMYQGDRLMENVQGPDRFEERRRGHNNSTYGSSHHQMAEQNLQHTRKYQGHQQMENVQGPDWSEERRSSQNYSTRDSSASRRMTGHTREQEQQMKNVPGNNDSRRIESFDKPTSEISTQPDPCVKRLSYPHPGYPQSEKEVMSMTKVINFIEVEYNLLTHYYPERLTSALEGVSFKVCGVSSLELSGIQSDIERAEKNLGSIKSNIQHEVIYLSSRFDKDCSVFLCKELFLSKDISLYEEQKTFEALNKCVITNRKSPPAHQPSSNPRSGTMGATSNAVDDTKRQSVFEVKVLREKVILEIKNFGNIVDERSNVLVCPLVGDKKLKTTSIGQAFIMRYPGLQKEVDKLSFWFNRVPLIQLQQNVYVAFVHMESYNVKTGSHAGSPSSKPGSYFQTIVEDVLSEASRLYVKSICFPSLGFGQIMKYPANYISENFLIGLKNFLKSGPTQLQKITFLATGPEVYEMMEQCASKHQSFQRLKSPKKTQRQGSREKPEANDDKNVEISIVHLGSSFLAPKWVAKLKSHCAKNEIPTPV